MRLTEDERASIKRIVAEVFGADSEFRLFGSCTDDGKRGGDVDLYVIPVQRNDLFSKRVVCLGRLEQALL